MAGTDDTNRVPAAIRTTIATVANDITGQYAGFILTTRDDVLVRRGGGAGVRIYQDLLRDPRVRTVIGKRKMAAVRRDWSVEPASEDPLDQRAADIVRAALERMPFDQGCKGLLNSTLIGFAVSEVLWDSVELPQLAGTFVVPARLEPRNPRRFVFDRDLSLRLLTPEAPAEGIPLPDRKFLVARHGEEETEDPYGLGLGHTLFWPVFFKRQGIAFWNVFAEKFGQPTAVGEYAPGTSDADQAKLLNALRNISQDSGIVVPQGTVLRLLEAMRSGSVDTYERLCDFMNTEISTCVLGSTLGTDTGDTGSRAAAQTHRDIEEGLVDADCDLLSDALYPLCRWITEINLPGARPPRIWREKPDEEDLNTRADRDGKVRSWGFEIDEQYVRDTYGDHWRRAAQPDRQPPAGRPDQRDMPGGAAFASGDEDRDAIDTLVDSILADHAPLMAPAVEQLVKAADEATDFAGFLDALKALEGQLDLGALRAQLERGAFAARMSGRLGVEPGDAV